MLVKFEKIVFNLLLEIFVKISNMLLLVYR